MLLAEVTLQTTQTVAQYGLGIGSVLAMICCWERERSLLSTIIAGFLSWIYVIYFEVTRRPAEEAKRSFFGRAPKVKS